MLIMGLTIEQFIPALLSIIMIDLVLGGDNAIVIGMACRNLPKNVQTKGIVLGTVGAVVIRILATLVIVRLLMIPGLRLVGGLVLLYIGYKLLAKPESHDNVEAKDSLLAAVLTIIVADAAMGIDNVLGVAGASHGSYGMVVIGLCISIPIMVFGSTLIIKLMNRFPIIIDVGAAVIAYTSAKMIAEEPLIHNIVSGPVFKYGLMVVAVAGVLWLGRRKRRQLQGSFAREENARAESDKAQ